MMMQDPAIMYWRLELASERKTNRPLDTSRVLSVWVTMLGHIKAFHWAIKDRMAMVATVFLFMGTMTRHRKRQLLVPSTLADL